jgi:hypothetical protein
MVSTFRSGSWVGVVLALAVAAGCKSTAIDPFTTGNESQPVGPGGGRVTASSGASATVPAGAVSATTTVGVDVAPGGGMPTLPANIAPVGDIVALTPHGVAFSAPVSIHIPFDSTRAAAVASTRLQLYTALPGGTWTAVDGARMGSGAADADVRHFSYYVVGYEVAEQTIPEGQARKLDLLFMIDDSLSMQPLEDQMLANFPAFMQTLRALPGGLPDLHLGVVSSDMGAGMFQVPQCAIGGDQGILQAIPRGTCVESPVHGNFIAASENEANKNYDGTIEDAFTCIANLGQMGCGFEHQLESVAVALGARGSAPPENAGFLRDDAMLGIVLLTNEDDCSAPADSTLFDPSSRLVSDPLGPLASWRCNEYGHLCAGKQPPRLAPDASTTSVMLDDCHSAEDGVLVRVSDYAQLLRGVKGDPSQVFLAAITGPPTPYVVDWVAPAVRDDPNMWPQIDHSCTTSSAVYADPAVRISDLVAAFGDNGLMESICDATWAPALIQIAAALGRGVAPTCLQAAIVDPSTPSLAPGCTVYESVPASGGFRTESVMPACDPNASVTAACWSLSFDMTCDSAVRIGVTRPSGGFTPPGAVLAVRCGMN